MEEVIRKYFQCWLDKDIDAVKGIFSDDIIYSECYGPVYKGIGQIIRWFEEWNQKGTVLQWDIKRVVVSGNTAAVEVFRCDLNKKLLEHIGLFHEIDVNTVVGRVARERNFCFPVASGDSPVSMGIRGLFHPALPGAVSNDLEITRDKNIFFLTGANMAGKSTLMKSFGIAVYMAHMGFPR